MTGIILTHKTFSLHGQAFVHDTTGRLLFEASRDTLFGRTMTMRDASGKPVATLEAQPWKPDPAWQAGGQAGPFVIKRHKKSFERSYWIEQGPYDGVVIEGGFKDRAFRIRKGEQIIAEADEKQFSARTEHALRLLDDSPEALLLSSLVGIVILKDKQDARRERA